MAKKPKLQMKYNIRYVRITGDDKDLLMERQLFGTIGPWQKGAYYNNEVYRLQAEMNKICDELAEVYAKYVKSTKKRDQIHRSINKATFMPEGIGFIEEDIKLPLFRKDKKPLEKPPADWLAFIQPIKQGKTIRLGCDADMSTTVELADDSAGSKDYPIRPVRGNQNQKNKRRGGGDQQHNNGQN